jgi:hypothetical protein
VPRPSDCELSGETDTRRREHVFDDATQRSPFDQYRTRVRLRSAATMSPNARSTMRMHIHACMLLHIYAAG